METTQIREVRVNYAGPRIKAPVRIKGPEDTAELLRKLLPDNSREHFIVVYLNGNNVPVGYSVLTGIANSCPVHSREVFQAALLIGAVAVIAGHNHPSGNLEISREDREVTAKLKNAANILGIRFLDHVIVSDSGYTSLEG